MKYVKKRLFTIKRTAASNSSIISAPESMIKKNLIILKKIEKFSPTTTLTIHYGAFGYFLEFMNPRHRGSDNLLHLYKIIKKYSIQRKIPGRFLPAQSVVPFGTRASKNKYLLFFEALVPRVNPLAIVRFSLTA